MIVTHYSAVMVAKRPNAIFPALKRQGWKHPLGTNDETMQIAVQKDWPGAQAMLFRREPAFGGEPYFEVYVSEPHEGVRVKASGKHVPPQSLWVILLEIAAADDTE